MAIVGGGYSGAAAGVQLARAARNAISITIIEPRDELGRGLAYSTPDPDHRLNGPLDSPVSCDHNDCGVNSSPANVLQYFKPTLVRHLDIEQDQFRALLLQPI